MPNRESKMLQKKGSKNAIENRAGKQIDSRGDQIQIMIGGKKQMVFEREGHYYDKKGELVEL